MFANPYLTQAAARSPVEAADFPRYVAQHNTQQANSFLVSQGYPASADVDELAGRLGNYINQNGQPGLQKVMQFHPDREEIMRAVAPGSFAPGFHNFSGGSFGMGAPTTYHNCGGCGGGGYSNCSGCGGKCGQAASASGMPPVSDRALNTLAILALAGILFFALRSQ